MNKYRKMMGGGSSNIVTGEASHNELKETKV